jgi:hypothetical protein
MPVAQRAGKPVPLPSCPEPGRSPRAPQGPSSGRPPGTIGARAGAGGAAQPHRIPVEQVLADHPAGSPLGGVPPLGINIQQYHLGITV